MANDQKRLVGRGYDAVSCAYRGDVADDATQQRYQDWLALLDPFLPVGGNILDLGCGCGLPATRILAAKYEVTGVDISRVQIERARAFVPTATFRCDDLATFSLAPSSYDGIVSLYAIIHVPVPEQRMLFRRMAAALRCGGALLMTVGHEAWTGTRRNWLGVEGATMYWSQECEAVYCSWIKESGLEIQTCQFVPEGAHGHSLVLATKK